MNSNEIRHEFGFGRTKRRFQHFTAKRMPLGTVCRHRRIRLDCESVPQADFFAKQTTLTIPRQVRDPEQISFPTHGTRRWHRSSRSERPFLPVLGHAPATSRRTPPRLGPTPRSFPALGLYSARIGVTPHDASETEGCFSRPWSANCMLQHEPHTLRVSRTRHRSIFLVLRRPPQLPSKKTLISPNRRNTSRLRI